MRSLADRVYDCIKNIPLGRVSTYKNVADSVGCRGYRAIGKVLNKNPFAPQVPCHRIVSSSGKIGGYALGAARKAEILREEGIEIYAGKISNFQERFFDLRAATGKK